MRREEKLCTGHYEARAIQIGEAEPQCAAVVVDWSAKNFLLTGHKRVRGMFNFDGHKDIDAAKAEAERFLCAHDASLPSPLGVWEAI
jgi:hypothetical protein